MAIHAAIPPEYLSAYQGSLSLQDEGIMREKDVHIEIVDIVENNRFVDTEGYRR